MTNPEITSRNKSIDISIILPCRNEEQALAGCLIQIKSTIRKYKLHAEIIVSDSSSDNSPVIARKFGVKLIKHDKEGYGRAYLEGFREAQGKYFFMADPDGSYDFEEIPRFINKLQQGADFVIGNRFAGQMDKESMPWLHRHFGNPILSFILRVFFGSKIRDAHCGMRAIKKSSLQILNLHTTGMEFASEMVIKATKKNLRTDQLPINYHKRQGQSKLRMITDGWRHLRFMLLYSPLFLFFIPGSFLFITGLLGLTLSYFNLLYISTWHFQYHPMFFASALLITGYQLIFFAVFAKTYAMTHLEEDGLIMSKLHHYVTLEKGSLVGFVISTIGLILFIYIVTEWFQNDFGKLKQIKNSIVALSLLTIGIQTIFSSFMLSILSIKTKD